MNFFYILESNKVVNKVLATSVDDIFLQDGQSIISSSYNASNTWVYSDDDDTFSPPLIGILKGENVFYDQGVYNLQGSDGEETGSFNAKHNDRFYIYTGSYNITASLNHPIVSFDSSNIVATNGKLNNISKIDNQTYSFTLQPIDEITGSLNEEEIKIELYNLTDVNNPSNTLSSQLLQVGYSSSLGQYELV